MPTALSTRVGMSPGNLQEVHAVTVDCPDVWMTFNVSVEQSNDGKGLYIVFFLVSFATVTDWSVLTN